MAAQRCQQDLRFDPVQGQGQTFFLGGFEEPQDRFPAFVHGLLVCPPVRREIIQGRNLGNPDVILRVPLDLNRRAERTGPWSQISWMFRN